MEKFKNQSGVVKDLAIIVLSVFVAVMLAKTGALENLITTTKELRFIGSFVAGILFVSVFTAAPATVMLGEIAQSNSVIFVAIVGGLGALAGDLIIFRFVRDRVSQHFAHLVKTSGAERFFSIFRMKIFRWVIPFVGALIIASPLPDEIGVTMLGLSKVRTSLFIPLSFLLNSLGILIIGLIAKSL